MRITYNHRKREKTLAESGLDFRRAREVFDDPARARTLCDIDEESE